MNDGLGTRPRLNWNPMTDSGGEAPPKRPEEGFSFNLGQALAKLGLDPDGPIDARRAVGDDQPLDALNELQRRFGPAPTDAPAAPTVTAPAPVVPAAPAAPAPAVPTAATVPLTDPAAPLARRVPRTPSVPIDDGPAVVAPVRALRPEIEEPLPTRQPTKPIVDEALPTRPPTRPATPIVDEALPTRPPTRTAPIADAPLPSRHSAAPAAAAPAPTPAPVEPVAQPVSEHSHGQVAPRRSVFDDVVASVPSLPPTVSGGPAATPRSVAPTDQPTLPASQHHQAAAATAATPAAAAPVLPPGLTAMPTLPPAAPKAMPIVAPVAETTVQQPDIRALRSAQIRAERQQRKRHPVLRGVGVLIVLGAIGAAALYFGRPFLFPTEWDPALTAIVDEIEVERGRPFDHTVGLVQQPVADFEQNVARLTIGDQWVVRVPEWRALGLAGGDVTLASVAATVRGDRAAIYDPVADRIYLPDDITATDAGLDLRLALEQAYEAQLGATPVAAPTPGLAGVSPTATVAGRAADGYLVDGADGDLATWQATPGIPAPVEYELLATDILGAAVLVAAGIDPSTATFDLPVGVDLGAALDDAPIAATPGALQVGERKLAEPVAIGLDDWSLVWAQRLPVATVQQLASIVTGDTYQPIDRNGVTCVVGTFSTGSAPEADVLLAEMTNWVTVAPLESQATATRLDERTVQLASCDPGPTVAVTPNPEAVRLVIDRQLARLAAA